MVDDHKQQLAIRIITNNDFIEYETYSHKCYKNNGPAMIYYNGHRFWFMNLEHNNNKFDKPISIWANGNKR